MTCFAENICVIILATSQPVTKTSKNNFPNGKVQNTHNNNRRQTIDTILWPSLKKNISSAPRCPRLLRGFFSSVQARGRHITNTNSQSDETDVTNTLFNINTNLKACQSSLVLNMFLRLCWRSICFSNFSGSRC